MARKTIQVDEHGEVQGENGVTVMEEGTVEPSVNGQVEGGGRKMPEWFPSELPEDEDGLLELVRKISTASKTDVPRGAYLFAKVIGQLTHHKPLYEQAQGRLAQTWAYMHGQTPPGSLKGARKRSVRSRAAKFYEALSEGALQRHCQMHGLDYDVLKEEGGVIDRLVEAASKLV